MLIVCPVRYDDPGDARNTAALATSSGVPQRPSGVDAAIARSMYTTFLASAFRSIRFGVNEAHGRGIAIQINSLLDAGAFKVMADGTFTVDNARIGEAVTALTREIMTLQAEGSYVKAKAMVDTLGVVRPEVQKVLDRLTTVPVDIEPKFTTAAALAR